MQNIANAGGFGVYGIMDGECYIGESADTLQPGSGCKSLDGDMVVRMVISQHISWLETRIVECSSMAM